MGVVLATGSNGKFLFGNRDHAVTDADINTDYDIVVPRNGVYSVSTYARILLSGPPTLGDLTAEIQANGLTVAFWIITPTPPATYVTGIAISFNISRCGVNLSEGDLVTVFCGNSTDVTAVFGSGDGHLDVSYEAERSLLL